MTEGGEAFPIPSAMSACASVRIEVLELRKIRAHAITYVCKITIMIMMIFITNVQFYTRSSFNFNDLHSFGTNNIGW